MTPRPLHSDGDPFATWVSAAASGRFAEALAGIERALGSGPHHPRRVAAVVDGLAEVARSAAAAGDLEHVAAAWQAARRVAPGYADVHLQLAHALIGLGQLAEARRSLDEALRLNPAYRAARVERSLLDARTGRLGDALEDLQRLGREDRIEDPSAFGEGLARLEHADWEEARPILLRALGLEPSDVAGIVRDIRALMDRGERPQALARARKALREHPSYADLHALVGAAELEEGILDDALASFARALEIHPDFHQARVQLARVLEAQGDLPQAEEQVGLVLESDPHHPGALELEERWRRSRRAESSRRENRGHKAS